MMRRLVDQCVVLRCFFDRAFPGARLCALNKSVAKMAFRLAYILNVTFVKLYHIKKIGGRAGDVMSYASFFIGREKSVRCGSLCNERTRLAPISVTTESPQSRRACLRCLALTSISRRFLQRWYDIRGETTMLLSTAEEQRMLRLLEMT